MNGQSTDPLVDAIASLPEVAPTATHALRVRARCLDVWARRAQRAAPWRLEPVAVTALCAMYAWYLARFALLITR